jgi:hypothetical protein
MTYDDPIPVAVHHHGAASCGRYSVGHDPHWIQVLRVAPRNVPVDVHAVRLIDPVSVELDVDRIDDAGRETVVRRNHDAIQIAATWARCGEGRFISGASLLQIGPRSGAANFSMSAGELGECSVTDATDAGDTTDATDEGGAA